MQALGAEYTCATPNNQGSTSASLWVLVLKSYTAPKQYLCKSDPNNTVVSPMTSGVNYFDNFGGVENMSYAMAIPWNVDLTKCGFWKNIVDATTPLMADQGFIRAIL